MMYAGPLMGGMSGWKSSPFSSLSFSSRVGGSGFGFALSDELFSQAAYLT